MALGGGLVVGRGVGHRVAVLGVGEDLGAEGRAGPAEGVFDRRDLLRRGAFVVVGEAEEELGVDLARAQVAGCPPRR